MPSPLRILCVSFSLLGIGACSDEVVLMDGGTDQGGVDARVQTDAETQPDDRTVDLGRSPVDGGSGDARIEPETDSGTESATPYIQWHNGVGLSLVQPDGSSLDGYLRGGDFDSPIWASNDGSSWYLLHIVEGGEPTTDFAYTTLPTVMGRDGEPATVLSVALLDDAPDTTVEQIEFLEEQGRGVAGESDPANAERTLVEPVFYQREWIKFDPNTAARAEHIGEDNFWQIFWEAKAQPDYRIRVQLVWSDGALAVEAHDDGLRDANPIYVDSGPVVVPIVMADRDSAEGWNLLEVWIDRTRGDEGRWRVRFGGVDIIDYTGPLAGESGNILNLPMFVQLYSDTDLTANPYHQLVDDFELWDGPPLDAWR